MSLSIVKYVEEIPGDGLLHKKSTTRLSLFVLGRTAGALPELRPPEATSIRASYRAFRDSETVGGGRVILYSYEHDTSV